MAHPNKKTAKNKSLKFKDLSFLHFLQGQFSYLG